MTDGPGRLRVGVAGPPGAGKTTLARCFADRLGVGLFGFGEFIRRTAHERGLPLTRLELQNLGEQLSAQLGWHEFCRQAAGAAGIDVQRDGFVADGVRHLGALTALRDLAAPARVALVFCDPPEQKRLARLEALGVLPEEVKQRERHPNERDVPLLRGLADVLVEQDTSVEACEFALRRLVN